MDLWRGESRDDEVRPTASSAPLNHTSPLPLILLLPIKHGRSDSSCLGWTTIGGRGTWRLGEEGGGGEREGGRCRGAPSERGQRKDLFPSHEACQSSAEPRWFHLAHPSSLNEARSSTAGRTDDHLDPTGLLHSNLPLHSTTQLTPFFPNNAFLAFLRDQIVEKDQWIGTLPEDLGFARAWAQLAEEGRARAEEKALQLDGVFCRLEEECFLLRASRDLNQARAASC